MSTYSVRFLLKRMSTALYMTVGGFRPLLSLLRGLRFQDRKHLLIAFCYLIYVESFLSAADTGFQFIAQLCDRKRRTQIVPLCEEHLFTLDQTIWAVKTASACFPNSKCLEEAVVQYLLLRKHSVPVMVIIGIGRASGDCPIIAHAWLECEGEVLYENPEVSEIYSPIMRIG